MHCECATRTLTDAAEEKAMRLLCCLQRSLIPTGVSNRLEAEGLRVGPTKASRRAEILSLDEWAVAPASAPWGFVAPRMPRSQSFLHARVVEGEKI